MYSPPIDHILKMKKNAPPKPPNLPGLPDAGWRAFWKPLGTLPARGSSSPRCRRAFARRSLRTTRGHPEISAASSASRGWCAPPFRGCPRNGRSRPRRAASSRSTRARLRRCGSPRARCASLPALCAPSQENPMTPSTPRAATRLGFQIPNFTFPGVPDTALFERVAVDGGAGGRVRLRHRLRDGPLLPAADAGAAGVEHVRGVHAARRDRRTHTARAARNARHRQHVPESGAAREDRHVARRDLGRARAARRRHRLVRGGAHRVRLPLRHAQGALRPLRGGARDPGADAARRAADLPRQTLRSEGSDQPPRAGPARRHPDHDRRRGREEDAATRRRARRREQPALPARRSAAEARRARTPLRVPPAAIATRSPSRCSSR